MCGRAGVTARQTPGGMLFATSPAMITTTDESKGTDRRGSRATPWLVGLLMLPLAAACSAKQERVVSTRTVTTVEEHAIPAPKMVDISIVDLHGEPALDPAQEKVVGTIINAGDRQVTGLSIRVDAIDGVGRVVRSITTPRLAQVIDPNGGRATFEAIVPRDDAVIGYHAIAIAR